MSELNKVSKVSKVSEVSEAKLTPRRRDPIEYRPVSQWKPANLSTPMVVNGSVVKPDKANGLVQPRNMGLFQILKKLSDVREELIRQGEDDLRPADEGGPTIQTSGANG